MKTAAEIIAPSERLLGATQVAERYGIHPKTVGVFVKQGKIPRPVAFSSAKRPKWRETDVNNHIRSLGWAGQTQAEGAA
jgi:predicted DNA-binding transcriptional regulator AlpA